MNINRRDARRMVEISDRLFTHGITHEDAAFFVKMMLRRDPTLFEQLEALDGTKLTEEQLVEVIKVLLPTWAAEVKS